MPKSMQRLDADILKRELGANAVRTSHYPQSHYFIERCDEIGLLVFTEIPGWQHIGDAAWKDQAVENVRDMVKQYRNHTSIILWGVRINESQDDDAFYRRTNEAAHEFDDSRPTGGVRANRKSSLLEDVYTYNDFVHDGKAKGCEPKKNVTSDMENHTSSVNTMGICIRRRHLTGKNTGQSMRSAMQMFWMRWQPRRTLQDALAGACLITTPTRISEVVTASVITESWICSAIRNLRQ